VNTFSGPFIEAVKTEAQQLSRWVDRASHSNLTLDSRIEKAIQLCLQSVENGGKIVVTGVGKSGKIGEKIAATLSSTGSFSIFLHPTDGMHGDIGVIQKHDVVLALSYSGNTEELLRLLPFLKDRKIPVISFVGNENSQLAQQSDCVIDASVAEEACPLHLAPTSSTTLALALGDALAVSLMKARGFQPEHFALNHPAGRIGKRLTLTVQDLMHPIKTIGFLSPQAKMSEVVDLSTRTRLGGILIIENQKLKGLITDGDIRRALQHEDQFFQFKASDIMTSQPSTVLETALADEALRLMEERPTQISVLPVMNHQGNVVGLLRLHDLVRTL
jgi:arabinose-5-phosphate isomerase